MSYDHQRNLTMQPAGHRETPERKEGEHLEARRKLSKMTKHEQESALRHLQICATQATSAASVFGVELAR
jgi:hypothetical protein